MRKSLLVTVLTAMLAPALTAQNVGIGEPAPGARLTVKSTGFNSSLLVKNGTDDSLMYTTYRNLHFGGYHLTNNGVVNISNKNFLPFDPAQLQLVAAGERSGGSTNGSLSMIKFANVNSDKYYYLSSYAGGEQANHNFSLNYLDPAIAITQTLLFIKPNGQTGIGTYLPTARLQVNHRSSAANPTVNLYDSASNGTSIVQFSNSGSSFWQIKGTSYSVSAAQSALSFSTQASTQMTIRGNGNVGIGEEGPTEKLEVNGNIKATGEINRTATGTANLVPIAYGNISASGFVHTGSGNISVSKISTGWYAITITGESYQFQTYVAVVTPVTGPAMVATGSGGGALYVYTYGPTGVADDNQFCFTVYKQ